MEYYRQRSLLLVLCLAIILFLAMWLIPKVKAPIEAFNNLNVVQDSYLLSITSPTIGTQSLLEEIIRRESGGDPKACNKKYGCLGGMGLLQIISGTWNTSLDRMQRDDEYLPLYCIEYIKLPVSEDRHETIFDPECHRIVGGWLLQTDGIRHWEKWSGPYDLSIYTF